MGRLVPIMCEEVNPGDKWSVSSNFVIRFAPMIAPLMHNIDVFVHFFYIPNRILWKNWELFITGGELGNSDIVFPQISFTDLSSDHLSSWNKGGHLADYLGCSTNMSSTTSNRLSISQLPFRAYHLCWLDFYRDENLQPLESGKNEFYYIRNDADGVLSFSRFFGSSVSSNSLFPVLPLRESNYIHDYFTSALPWTQRGPSSSVPVTFSASPDIPISFKNPNVGGNKVRLLNGAVITGAGDLTHDPSGTLQSTVGTPGTSQVVVLDNSSNLKVNMTDQEAALSILDFRRANINDKP